MAISMTEPRVLRSSRAVCRVICCLPDPFPSFGRGRHVSARNCNSGVFDPDTGMYPAPMSICSGSRSRLIRPPAESKNSAELSVLPRWHSRRSLFAGWVNRQQLIVIDYRMAENRSARRKTRPSGIPANRVDLHPGLM